MRQLLAIALLAAATAGCAAPPPEAAWQRFDLWLNEPRVEVGPGPAVPAYRQLIDPLGAGEVRDLSQVPPNQLAVFPHQSAGLARLLEQATASRLVWTVTLGEEPYFSFTPLLDAEAPCDCTFRVGVRLDGELSERVRLEPPVPPPAPATVEVDLAPWAGRTVELLLQLDGPPGGRGRWASPAVYSRAPAPAPRVAGGRPNVLVVGLDTVRADHLGAYRAADAPAWSGPSLTPALDRLAAESDLWLDAQSNFNVTNPSFASLFTGLYGKNHGVYDLKTPLPPGNTTLAELFSDAGYATMAVISAHHLGNHNSGLAQGFDEVTTARETFTAELAVEMTMDWIAERQGAGPGDAESQGAGQRAAERPDVNPRQPFFAWLHLFDPHTPHTPPAPYALGFGATPSGLAPVNSWRPFRSPGPVAYTQPVLAGNRQLYAGEMAYLDRQLDRLLGFLDSRGLLANTVVVVVADHGENLGEHGFFFRHVGLWETTLAVPLMIRWPGTERRGRRLSGLVEGVDLFPTLLAAAGIEAPPSDGEDLLRLTGDGHHGKSAVFAEHAHGVGEAVRTAHYRLVRSHGHDQIADGLYLYDLDADPAEEVNLAGQGLAVEQRLTALLERWLADRRPGPETQPVELSPEEADRLRSLGYLE